MDIGPILRYYGAETVPPELTGWRTIRCPFHSDSKGSGRVSMKDGAYCCQACPAKGNCISLVMWKENCDYGTAIRFLEENIGSGYGKVSESDGQVSSPVPSRPRPFERNSSVLPSRRRPRPFAH